MYNCFGYLVNVFIANWYYQQRDEFVDNIFLLAIGCKGFNHRRRSISGPVKRKVAAGFEQNSWILDYRYVIMLHRFSGD